MLWEKSYVTVDDAAMAYVEFGTGRPIVFLHGNPTNSYLWRKVAPAVEHLGRCILPDLVGMGDSSKVESDYRFVDHRRYLDGLLDQLGVFQDVVLVVHDWGGGLGFDWANRHRPAVAGIAYMETLVCPVTWEDWPESARPIFQALRSPAGETMVLERNLFVERILPASVLEPLSEEEMAEYRRPFLEPGEGRRPTLTWPRQIPIEGEPADVAEIVADYSAWLAGSNLPKLFVNAEPGSILTGRVRRACRAWPNQVEVTVPGVHFIQEDSGEAIGAALAAWLPSV
jgi:haloalkane dehalogenase